MSPTFLRSPLSAVLLTAAAASQAAPSYPIEIEHALGVTVIEHKPERVATVSWANHEVPLALGVVPVGFAAMSFGDNDDNGIQPWVEARLAELDAGPFTLYDEGDGIDFESVAASRPDVILAAYSGMSQEDYATLSKIAPVVAYPEAPWASGWRDMIRLNSAGMGMAEEGEMLIERLEAQIDRQIEQHPELAGKSAMLISHLKPTDLSQINFYNNNDARVRFLHEFGLSSPQFVTASSVDGRFSGSISAERIDEIADVDIIITYGGQPLVERLNDHMLTSRLPAIEQHALVMLGNDPQGAAANPTPLSIPWVLETYVDQLSRAALKSEQE